MCKWSLLPRCQLIRLTLTDPSSSLSYVKRTPNTLLSADIFLTYKMLNECDDTISDSFCARPTKRSWKWEFNHWILYSWHPAPLRGKWEWTNKSSRSLTTINMTNCQRNTLSIQNNYDQLLTLIRWCPQTYMGRQPGLGGPGPWFLNVLNF